MATTRVVELKPAFDNNSRVTGQAEAEFWKSYAAELERNNK